MHRWQRFASAIFFFICFEHCVCWKWKGHHLPLSVSIIKVPLSNTHKHTHTSACRLVSLEIHCGGSDTREPTSSLGESSLQLSPRVRAFKLQQETFLFLCPVFCLPGRKKRTSLDTLSVKVGCWGSSLAWNLILRVEIYVCNISPGSSFYLWATKI